MTTSNLVIQPELRKLYDYLLERGNISGLDNYNDDCLRVFSREVLRMIKDGDADWESMVPVSVANLIKTKNYFDYQPA